MSYFNNLTHIIPQCESLSYVQKWPSCPTNHLNYFLRDIYMVHCQTHPGEAAFS